jgi:glyoxylase-like metal-dependent hydrolase (beta-lactamase superfamily II)
MSTADEHRDSPDGPGGPIGPNGRDRPDGQGNGDSRAPRGFTILPSCISCGASREVAPDLVRAGPEIYEFFRQPESAAEWQAAWRAVHVCPVAAVRFEGDRTSPSYRPAGQPFPQQLLEGVWRLGYAAESTFGAHAYAARTRDGLVMVDGPRWSGRLKQWLAANGGLAHILLTHRDDVGAAEEYARAFGARVWIHEADRDAAPFATDILSGATTAIADGLTAIHLPGHTRGSVVFHLRSPPHQSAPVLFGGDTLAWDRTARRLVAFRDACWYSWAALQESLAGFARSEYRFAHCFAGHGGSVSADVQSLHAELQALLARM